MQIASLSQLSLKQCGSTQAFEVTISPYLTLYFSYQTVIGFRDSQYACRRPNTFSRTTGKHYKLLGLNAFEEVPDDQFLRELNQALARSCNV
jgi:hypothetical protein